MGCAGDVYIFVYCVGAFLSACSSSMLMLIKNILGQKHSS